MEIPAMIRGVAAAFLSNCEFRELPAICLISIDEPIFISVEILQAFFNAFSQAISLSGEFAELVALDKADYKRIQAALNQANEQTLYL